MTKTILPVTFFFGANNKERYCSLYRDSYNPYEKGNHIILKGGPGTGKSTIMKKVADTLGKRGYYIERGYCSADPESLDIVIAPEINFSILDGTSPHTLDPVLPGVTEHIVDLGVSWDRKYLKSHINEIGEIMKNKKEQHSKVQDYLKVASEISRGDSLIINRFLEKDKLQRYAQRLSKRLIPQNKNAERGKENKRFLSAISPEGVVVCYDTIVALSEKIITIEDEFSYVAPYIAEYVGEYALENGFDVYKCYCPLFPFSKVEHLIIPELKVSIFTENSYHLSIDDFGKKVHASRFYEDEGYRLNKEKLLFRKKAKKELIDEAVRHLSLAKDFHSQLEDYYIKATDYNVIDEITEKILSSL